MGFFSWRTQDTDKSISNAYSEKGTFPVFMIDDKGNIWYEDEYEGYGEFGGKDYYELLAEMNPEYYEKDKYEDLRDAGIEIAFGTYAEDIKHPNLVERVEGWEYDSVGPESCEFQGYFYDMEDY